MSLDAACVRRRLEAAYSALIQSDRMLLELDANERSITHKLAEHLQCEFPGWNVDCEYNRNGAIPKRLIGEVERVNTDSTEGNTVYPDIIVHRRGSSQNLVVIEAKKSTTAQDHSDEAKLRSYKSEHGYEFAYAIVFPVGIAAEHASAGSDLWEVGG